MLTNRGEASSTLSLRHATHAVILREMSGSFRSPNASRRAMAEDEAGTSGTLIVFEHGVESVILGHGAGVGERKKVDSGFCRGIPWGSAAP